VGLEWGPLSLVSTTEELLRRKSGSSLEIRDYGRRGSAALITGHPSLHKSALTSPTRGGRSVVYVVADSGLVNVIPSSRFRLLHIVILTRKVTTS
jgi:hypothetical protein